MLPAKPFYLIRHGETEANAAHITAGGEFDTPLTQKGRSQAQQVAARIHQLEIKPTRIIHSPLSRARDTAGFINQTLKLEIHEVFDLREHVVGEWEGQPWADVFPHLKNNVRPKGGENKDDFAHRVKKTLRTVLETHEDPVMLVAHGGTFFSILHLYGHPYDGHVDNCHLHYFEPYAGGGDFPWKVWQFDIEEENLLKNAAPFCSTLKQDKVA